MGDALARYGPGPLRAVGRQKVTVVVEDVETGDAVQMIFLNASQVNTQVDYDYGGGEEISFQEFYSRLPTFVQGMTFTLTLRASPKPAKPYEYERDDTIFVIRKETLR